MDKLIVLALLFIAGYYCWDNAENFRGRNLNIRNWLYICSGLGLVASVIFLVWLIVIMPWWQPVLAILVAPIIGGFFGKECKSLLGSIICRLAVIILIAYELTLLI